MTRRILILPLLVGWVLLGCSKNQDSQKEITLARVGDKDLTLKAAKSNIPSHLYSQDSLRALHEYRQRWIKTQLLVQEAERIGLDQKPEVQTKLQISRDNTLSHELKSHILHQDTSLYHVSIEEAKNYYERYKEQFTLNERHIRYRHLVTKTLEEARRAKSALLQGKPWEEVVELYALDKAGTLKRAKQIYPVSMSLTQNEIMHNYLSIIGINEISPIREINGQYHFVQLVKNYAKGTHTKLDWILPKIKEWLAIEKRRKIFNSYVRNLYLKAKSNNEINLMNDRDDLPDTITEIDTLTIPANKSDTQ